MKTFWETWLLLISTVAALLSILFNLDRIRQAGNESWMWFSQIPVGSILGVLVFSLLVLFPIVLVALLFFRKFSPEVRLAVRSLASRQRRHANKAIDDALPPKIGGLVRKPDVFVKKMLGSMLRKYTSGWQKGSMQSEYSGHELLPANFEVYAQCVNRVFEEVRKLKGNRGLRVPEVYTVLKKPLADWFNLCSIPTEIGGQRKKCAFTRLWWECYKGKVANATKSVREVRMSRLIVPMGGAERISRSLIHIEGPIGEHFDGYRIDEARNVVGNSPQGLRIPEGIARTLEFGRGQVEEDMRIHLIGSLAKDSDVGQLQEQGWVSLVDHFECTYHNGSTSDYHQANTQDEAGVYYGYVDEGKLSAAFRGWLSYGDVFAIRLRHKRRKESYAYFAIAFYEDRVRDVRGIRVLQTTEAIQFVDDFLDQWGLASEKLLKS